MLYTISIYHGICSPLKNPIDRSARSMPKRPRSNWTSARRPSTVPRMASLSARWRWVLRFFWRKHYDTTIKQYDNIWMLWMFVFWCFPAFFGLNRLSVDCCYHAFLAKLFWFSVGFMSCWCLLVVTERTNSERLRLLIAPEGLPLVNNYCIKAAKLFHI